MLGLVVLAQHQDADVGELVAQHVSDPDAFVGVVGWHADVGQHDVGPVLIDGGEQLVVGRALGDDVEIVLGLEQANHTLSHEQVVLGDDDPDHRR